MSITLVTGPANSGKAQVVIEAVRATSRAAQSRCSSSRPRTDVEHYLRELAGRRPRSACASSALRGARRGDGAARRGPRRRRWATLARERLLAPLVAARAGRGAARASRARSASSVAELQLRAGARRRAWRAALAPGSGTAARRSASTWRPPTRPTGAARAARAASTSSSEPCARSTRCASAVLRSGAERTPVLFYGFDDLTPLQLDAIETLGRVVDAPVTVSLPYEPGRTAFAGRAGTFQTLAPHRRASTRAAAAGRALRATRSRTALAHLERSLFEPRRDAGRAARCGVELLQGGGERAELELVAARGRRAARATAAGRARSRS